MSGYSSPSYPPQAFEKAIVLVDGTNLFYRLAGAKLRLTTSLSKVLTPRLGNRQLLRIYMYTVQEHLAHAEGTHGSAVRDGMRIRLGTAIPTGDGNLREKGVDALLVADLIYHAATRNVQYALLVSTDTDFELALQRAEDFGCRTGVLAVCSEASARLRQACDDYFEIGADEMITRGWATSVRQAQRG